jgi:hypothetical protein
MHSFPGYTHFSHTWDKLEKRRDVLARIMTTVYSAAPYPRSTATRQGQCSHLRSTVFAAAFCACQVQLHIRSRLVWHYISFRGRQTCLLILESVASCPRTNRLQVSNWVLLIPKIKNVERNTICTRFCVRRQCCIWGFQQISTKAPWEKLWTQRSALISVIFHYELP